MRLPRLGGRLLVLLGRGAGEGAVQLGDGRVAVGHRGQLHGVAQVRGDVHQRARGSLRGKYLAGMLKIFSLYSPGD